MKKTTILLLDLLSVMLLLAGCSDKEQTFTEESYETDAAQIKEITIDVRDRAIEVSLSADGQIRIDYSESEQEYYDISVSDDQVLTMTAESNKKWSDYIGGSAAGSGKISLQIPDSMLSKLTLATTNEDITLASLTVNDDISLTANGGDITFDKINVGNSLTVTGKNGNVSGTIIGGYDDYSINCDIKKGENNLPFEKKGGAKTLNVSNNNGDIDIEFVRK